MSDQACCAHRHIVSMTVHDGVLSSDRWECRDCKTEFRPFFRVVTPAWLARGETRPQRTDSGWPSRQDITWFSPAEHAIRAAMLVVEEAGASVTLTQAVMLLGQAGEKVADHYEGLSPEESVPSASDAECGVPLGRSGHIQFVCRLPLGHEGSHRNAAVPGPGTTARCPTCDSDGRQCVGFPDHLHDHFFPPGGPETTDEGMTESIHHEAVPDVTDDEPEVSDACISGAHGRCDWAPCECGCGVHNQHLHTPTADAISDWYVEHEGDLRHVQNLDATAAMVVSEMYGHVGQLLRERASDSAGSTEVEAVLKSLARRRWDEDQELCFCPSPPHPGKHHHTWSCRDARKLLAVYPSQGIAE